MNRNLVLLPSSFRNTLLIALLLVATPAAAQQPGSISGTVTDQSRARLPGVMVTLTSPALQTPEITKVTDEGGTYQFTELPVGTYRLVFDLTGFGQLVREGIQISTGFAARIDVTLTVAQLAETVTVSGESPLVDLINTRGGAVLNKDLLQNLPVTNNYQDVLNLMPGVTFASPSPYGQIAGGGIGASSYKTYGVDRGPRFSATGGSSMTSMIEGIETRTGGFPNFATVEEVAVRTYGNTAEITRPGSVQQLVVKSGGNDFHGRYEEEFMTDRFQGTNIDSTLRAQGIKDPDSLRHFQDFAGDLGGRIIRNKLWFYGAVRHQNNVGHPGGFIGSAGPDGIYGTADDVPGTRLVTLLDRVLKLSYQMTPQHRLIVFADRDHRFDHEANISRFIPHESANDSDFPHYLNKAEWQGVFSNRLVGTFMVADSGSNIHQSDLTHPWTHASTLDLTTQQVTGEGFGETDSDDRYSKRVQYNGSLSYVAGHGLIGTHEFKIGGNVFLSTSTLNQWSRPAGDYQMVFDSGNPTQLKTVNSPFSTLSHRTSQGVFLMDTWHIANRLVANVGVRVDHFHLYVDGANKPAGQFSAAASYPRAEAGKWWTVGPRAGVSYDLTGTGRTAVKASFGGYSDDETEFFLQRFGPLAYAVTTWRWRDLNGNKRYDPGEVILDPNGGDFLSVTGGNQAPSSFKLPYSYEATAALEHQLNSSMAVRALYVYTTTKNELEMINPLRPYSAFNIPIVRQDPGPDGVSGTADDGGPVTLYDYDPAYRGTKFVYNQWGNRNGAHNDHHNSLEIGLTKRTTGWLSGQTTFLATKHHRWLTGYPQSPNDLNFPIDETWELSYRAAGYATGPHRFNVSAVFMILNGAPGQRTYLFRSLPQLGTLTVPIEPFGTRRGPIRSNLDLRVAKEFVLERGPRFNASFDLFNALNTNAAWVSTYQSGPTFGYSTTIASPRVARFGVTFSF